TIGGRQAGVGGVLGAVWKSFVGVRVDPVCDDSRPLLFELEKLQQTREALERFGIDDQAAAIEHHQVVEIEASLHVFEQAFEFAAAVDRDRWNGRGPLFGEIVALTALLGVAAQRVRRPGFAAERYFESLIEREASRRAALVQKAAEADVHRE